MAEVPWVVRFVDKPETGRVTRLDLNSEQSGGDVYVRPEGFSLGVGEKEVAVSESMLTEGETVTAWKRSNRELSIPLAVVGGSIELATVLNALARELDRPTNYLEFKPSDHSGESVFFTLVPGSDFGEVALDPEDYPSEKGAQVVLTCEPVGVGLPVTGSVVVSNNPAAASENQRALLPTIKGDVPAPLNLQLQIGDSPTAGGTILTNVSPSGGYYLQAENATYPDADTSLQTNDAAMSGTGSNYARTTFTASAALKTRVEWTGLVATWGTYKVLARVRKTSAAAVFNLRRYLRSPGGNDFYGPLTQYGATANVGPHWVDLGPVTFPAAGDIPPGSVSGGVGGFRIEEQRVSGTGSLDVDAVRLIPTDVDGGPVSATALVWHDWGVANLVIGLNAEADEVWSNVGGASVGFTKTRRGGPLPMVHPGSTNYLHLLRHVGVLAGAGGTGLTADSIAWSTTVDWSYRPKWLYLSAPAP